MPQHHMDSGHSGARAVLRVIGPAFTVVGAVFMVIGIGNFFWAFNNQDMPRYFWCAFVGMPLLGIGIGIGITKFAYLGAITRYMTNEVAPVGKDAVNYLGQTGIRRRKASPRRSSGPGSFAAEIRPRQRPPFVFIDSLSLKNLLFHRL